MATWKYDEGHSLTAPAAVDLTDKLNYFAIMDSNGNFNVNTVNGGPVFGSIYEVAKLGEPVTVQFGVIVKVRTGAAIVIGSQVQSDGNGKAITKAAGERVGFALGNAVAADQFIPVLIA